MKGHNSQYKELAIASLITAGLYGTSYYGVAAASVKVVCSTGDATPRSADVAWEATRSGLLCGFLAKRPSLSGYVTNRALQVLHKVAREGFVFVLALCCDL